MLFYQPVIFSLIDRQMESPIPSTYTGSRCVKCQACPCSIPPTQVLDEANLGDHSDDFTRETATAPNVEESLTGADLELFQQASAKLQPSFKKYERQWMHQGEKFDRKHQNEPWFGEWKEWLELWQKVDIVTRVAQDPVRMHQYVYMQSYRLRWFSFPADWHWLRRALKKYEKPYFREWIEFMEFYRYIHDDDYEHPQRPKLIDLYFHKYQPVMSKAWEKCV
ncbi:hypothetical protein BT63DRAFT_460896 [Microthyrium microscopicum]|uniref:Uncharacterized protein n=1 Tax=Microthyrium microscopicum TaxID=703497 RepID=A0A6A6TWQ9_9PEZI|nr:hypothetical protein BT63DRAFT_460896 [Microthyrium microscopicum]